MRVLFRVDSATHIGAGHVMRCLTLADQLRAEGAACEFICRDLPGAIMDKIEEAGHGLKGLSAPTSGFAADANSNIPHAHWLGVSLQQDLNETRQSIQDCQYDWLVVDHYSLDSGWLTPMRAHASKIAVIDELADRSLDCDLLICQSLPYEMINDAFDARLPAHAVRMIGPHYALLRPEFAAARERAGERVLPPKRVFVANGYMDAGGLIPKTLQALKQVETLHVDVAIGASSPSLKMAQELAATMRNVHIHVDATNMAALMANADFAIGGGGANSFERAAVGLPSLAISVAANQIGLLEFINKQGAVDLIGSLDDLTAGDIAAAVTRYIDRPDRQQTMARAAIDLCDGEGAQRIVNTMMGRSFRSCVTMRPVAEPDRDRLRNWRNQDFIRSASLTSHEISMAEHNVWFDRILTRNDGMWCVAEIAANPIGHVNAVSRDNGTFEWSFYIGEQSAPKGTGTAMLALFLERLFTNPQVNAVSAQSLRANPASCHLHRKLGFQQTNGPGADIEQLLLLREDWQRNKSLYDGFLDKTCPR